MVTEVAAFCFCVSRFIPA